MEGSDFLRSSAAVQALKDAGSANTFIEGESSHNNSVYVRYFIYAGRYGLNHTSEADGKFAQTMGPYAGPNAMF